MSNLSNQTAPEEMGKNNRTYLENEAKRTGKTVWHLLDKIVLEHQGREMFKRQNEAENGREPTEEELTERTQHQLYVLGSWAEQL